MKSLLKKQFLKQAWLSSKTVVLDKQVGGLGRLLLLKELFMQKFKHGDLVEIIVSLNNNTGKRFVVTEYRNVKLRQLLLTVPSYKTNIKNGDDYLWIPEEWLKLVNLKG